MKGQTVQVKEECSECLTGKKNCGQSGAL